MAGAEQWENDGERQALTTEGGLAKVLRSEFISGEQDSSEQGSDMVRLCF